MTDDEQIERLLRASPTVMRVLEITSELALPDGMLFSGALYQTVWNALTGRAADHGVKDYDLGYFEPGDTSYLAEDAVIRRVAAAFDPPLREKVEVRNQARVHLWFERRFGAPYAPLTGAAEALARFVAPACAIGARLGSDGRLELLGPFGFGDLLAMRFRPNPDYRPQPASFERVARRLQERWPELLIEDR